MKGIQLKQTFDWGEKWEKNCFLKVTDFLLLKTFCFQFLWSLADNLEKAV